MLKELEQLEEGGYSQALYFVKYYPNVALPGSLNSEFIIAKTFHKLLSQWLSGGLPSEVQKRIRVIFPELTGLHECQFLYHFISLIRMESKIPETPSPDSLKMIFEETQAKKRPGISHFIPIVLGDSVKKQKIIQEPKSHRSLTPARLPAVPDQLCHACETPLKKEETKCSLCETPKKVFRTFTFGAKETIPGPFGTQEVQNPSPFTFATFGGHPSPVVGNFKTPPPFVVLPPLRPFNFPKIPEDKN